MIERIKRKKGFTYRARIRLPDGKYLSKSFKEQKSAKAWLTEASYRAQSGYFDKNEPDEQIVFNELVRLWYKNKVKTTNSPRTIENYKSDVAAHLLNWLTEVPIQDLKRSHGHDLIVRMKKSNHSIRTINKILGRLKQILNYAVDVELLQANPLNRFPKLKAPPDSDFYLTHKEVQQLLVANNREWIYPLLFLAVNTGMRLGELAGLCWDRVNFERGMIEVTRTLTREGLQQTTKSHKKRFVPFDKEVELFLRSERQKQRHPQFVLLNKKGSPIDVNHVSQRAFKDSAKRAGLRTMKFHGLRHTYASHFMMNGGNIYTLQKILGHSDLQMTMRYAHLSPEHLKDAVGIVSFSGNGPQSGPQNLGDSKNLRILST